MKRYKISDMFAFPDQVGYEGFSKYNKPSKEMFRRLFNSILWPEEVAHTASTSNAGHVMRASNTEIKNRANTSEHTKVVDVTQLPGLMLGDATGYTIHGSAVKKNGLQMTEYTNDTSGAKDFMIDFLASSTYFAFDGTTKELLPKGYGDIGAGKYWGTPAGSSTLGFYDITTSTKVLVAGAATADYLNANQFQYVDGTVHVALKLSANKIWVGKDYGAYESVEEIATATAFNKAFGFTTSDIVEIGASLGASQVAMTDANKKLITVAAGDAHNKSFGSSAGTVAEGNHTHGTFGTSTAGFVPAPGSILGKVLSDSGTWIEMQASSDTYKVKAATGDGTPGFLDAKVDNSTLAVVDNKLQIKDEGVDFVQLDPKVLQYAEMTITHSQLIALYTNPQTLVTCPSINGYDVTIIVVDASIYVNYTDVYYQTYTTIQLYTATSTCAQMGEDYALTSTVDRHILMKRIHVDNASKTQLIKNQNLLIGAASGNPVPVGLGTTASYTIKVWYRLELQEELP